jgi:hypothetical protein
MKKQTITFAGGRTLSVVRRSRSDDDAEKIVSLGYMLPWYPADALVDEFAEWLDARAQVRK